MIDKIQVQKNYEMWRDMERASRRPEGEQLTDYLLNSTATVVSTTAGSPLIR